MNQPYHINYSDRRPELVSFATSAYEFKPTGKLQWLQRLCWKFLHKRKALSIYHDTKTIFKQHRVEPGIFLGKLTAMRRDIMHYFNANCTRLIIGAKDYCELMSCPEMNSRISFTATYRTGPATVAGLKVEVVPWMEGFVILPEESK